ncbi:MAG: Uma2 family endonuclease [Candidatus Rifleibacteriota bacterium]
MVGSAKKGTGEKPGKKKKYSYADYLTWQDGRRYELIDGEVFAMTPAPGFDHQEICGAIFAEFRSFLKGKKCRAIIAPFDVVFSRKSDDLKELHTILQPDISIFCDQEKIGKNSAFGAPDLVVEVVLPSTASHDNVRKRHIYEQAGVREYWLVYPEERYVRVYQLDDQGKFGKENTFEDCDRIQVGIFPDLTIDMTEIFPPAPKVPIASPDI